ncbi:DinB family protein [Calidifontibacter terrae]
MDFFQQQIPGSTFRQIDVSESRFAEIRANKAQVTDADLRDLQLNDVALDGLRIRGAYAEERGIDIDGAFSTLTVNGIDVMPLVEQELGRQFPPYALLKPADPAGFRAAWDAVEAFWETTMQRVAGLDEELLHQSVDGEWSFIQTLRHLVMATECWVLRSMLRQWAPWHPLSLPWSTMPPTEGVPNDPDARPSLAEVIAARKDRMAVVRRVVDDLTSERIDAPGPTLEGPGWPPEGESFTAQICLHTVFNEEFWHHRYALRDLAVLTGETW